MESTIQSENSPELLENLKKSIELWFHKNDSSTNAQIVECILKILLNNLKNSINYQEFANDLFWLNLPAAFFSENSLPNIVDDKSFAQVLSSWILYELRHATLCSCLKLLLTDKELVDTYYKDNAFLRDEIYSNACIMCILSVQQNNPVPLSLISQSLYIPVKEHKSFKLTHRRTSSYTHYSASSNLLMVKRDQVSKPITLEKNLNNALLYQGQDLKNEQNYQNLPCLKLKRCKSLPIIIQTFKQTPSCKIVTEAMPIPNANQQPMYLRIDESISKMSCSPEVEFSTPDSNSNYQQPSSSSDTTLTKIQNYDKGAIKKVCSPESKQYRKQSLKEKIRILKIKSFDKIHINNEDIKIHFDKNHCSLRKDNEINEIKVVEYNSPPSVTTSLKGISPINFLSYMSKNIFSSGSDPILLKSNHRLSANSYSSSFTDSFSTSLKTSEVLGSLVCTREGQKLVKAHTTIYDDLLCIQNDSNINDSDAKRKNIITENQNIASLLKSNLFSANNTDLERENAHFKISEAVISSIEQIKWTKIEMEQNKIKNLIVVENKIPIIKEKTYNNQKEKINQNTDIIEIVETATSYLDSKDDSSAPSTAESACEDKDYDDLLDTYDNILPEHVASAEWGYGFDNLSAENVGLSLISKFNDKDLPKVSELKWLVSEEICTKYNVPQDFLPIPEINNSDNPDDHIVHQIQRGTRDWAPPRKQIIFTDHQPATRKELIQKQNYRCAGCGMRVAPIYSNRFRYCYYLGKYHCTGCHRNHRSIIPAKVLKKWDFGLYPVSVFSYRLLEEIWQYPLFTLSDIAPTLYKRVRCLEIVKNYRTQLKYLKDFITECRFSVSEERLFSEIQTYITADPDRWSMSDFIDTKDGTLQNNLKVIINKCKTHVSNCVLCYARGFICEVCLSDIPIYPWEIIVTRCDKCGNCYHKKCFQSLRNKGCSKCYRLSKKSFDTKELNDLKDLYCI